MHIANRLVEVGCNTAFAVPGDFNLLLLDQLLKHKELDMVWCCNELNAGYAADGYARKRGVGCVVVTFCVGGFSVLNAIAGAASEDMPVIVISGVPNSNDYAQNRVLHHTTGQTDFNQQLRAFREVVCCAVTVHHLEEAARLVDQAISEAMVKRKPAYIEVACNLADLTHPSFYRPPVPYALSQPVTNQASLAAAVEAVAGVLDRAVKPVLLAGPRLRPAASREAFLALADSSKYAVAMLPDAKGLVPEDHPQFMGLYWGAVSWPCVCEVVESADVVVTCGAVWTDYTTVGYSLLLKPDKIIKVADNRVTVCGGLTFGCVLPHDFMRALAARIKPNHTAYENYARMAVPLAQPPPQPDGEPLKTTVLFKHIQAMLTPDTALISEVGDSWFNTQKLRLPAGCEYEIQLRYGSIGWSVGAVLGYAVAARGAGGKARVRDSAQPTPADATTKGAVGTGGGDDAPVSGSAGAERSAQAGTETAGADQGAVTPEGGVKGALERVVGVSAGQAVSVDKAIAPKRVLALIGDGSFQMTAQEVSTMLRYSLNPIIFLLNNGGYTIEVEIHDGPYNVIKNWDYTAMICALHNSQGGALWTTRVRTEKELVEAIRVVQEEQTNALCFIEVLLHRDDCSKELLEWGARVATANSRPPVHV